jgi:hypothetical protein
MIVAEQFAPHDWLGQCLLRESDTVDDKFLLRLHVLCVVGCALYVGSSSRLNRKYWQYNGHFLSTYNPQQTTNQQTIRNLATPDATHIMPPRLW